MIASAGDLGWLTFALVGGCILVSGGLALLRVGSSLPDGIGFVAFLRTGRAKGLDAIDTTADLAGPRRARCRAPRARGDRSPVALRPGAMTAQGRIFVEERVRAARSSQSFVSSGVICRSSSACASRSALSTKPGVSPWAKMNPR